MKNDRKSDRNSGCRIKTELIYKGYQMVIMENEQFRLAILPGKGTDIIELLYKPTDTDFCWFSQLGLRKKEAVFTSFQAQYEGGWQEILPNLSDDHIHNGVKLDAYGEVSLAEWSFKIVKDEPEEIVVLFEIALRTMPLLLEKCFTMKTNEAGFTMQEIVKNNSPAEMYFDWGHHITFGTPFLQPGMIIEVPGEFNNFVLPVDKSTGGFDVIPCEKGCYRITNPKGMGAVVSWDPLIWPYVWFWRDFGATTAAPYYGNHYNVGLEIFSSPPAATLQENINKGSAIQLPAFGQKKAYLNFSVCTKQAMSIQDGVE